MKDAEMAEPDLTKTVAYCGLVCGVCAHATPQVAGCAGCRHGGGARDCYQRECCMANGLDGCWQCEEFPCDKGFFGDPAWNGLCIGAVQCVREHGVQGHVDRFVARLGRTVDYGEYRNKAPEEIAAILGGDAGP
jgi:hypothetical protein